MGKSEFERVEIMKFRSRVIIKDNSFFYSGSEVNNLANDPQKISIGSNCHIFGSITVMPFGGQIYIGDNCSIGDHSRIVSATGICIGNRVMIAHNVNIIDSNSHPISPNERHRDFLNSFAGGNEIFDIKSRAVKIEDDVWIGFNSTILKGVTIGKGVIVGSDSVVTHDLEQGTINVGSPVRCVGRVDMNAYE